MKEFDEKVILETEHLILRFPIEEDTRSLFENINHDKDVLKYYVDKYLEKPEDYDFERFNHSFIKNKTIQSYIHQGFAYLFI